MTKHVRQLLSPEERQFVVDYALSRPWSVDSWGRQTCDVPLFDTDILSWLYDKCFCVASSVFARTTIIPTYYKFCRYSPRYGAPRVPPHIDENACTYTVDIQLDSSTEWPIYIDFEEFKLTDGDAVLYMGEDQLHWRPPFPSDHGSEFVTMLFAHYAEPEHWFFKYGQNHIYDKDFHSEWIAKMKSLLSSARHETMTELDENVLFEFQN